MGTSELKGLLAASLVSVMLVGCGGGGDAGEPAEGAPEAAAPAENPVDAATAGNVHGTIKFTGTKPAPEPIDMSDEPVCQTAAGGNAAKETVVVGADGGLANVFVYVKEGLDPALKFPAGPGKTIDQQGCTYHPHVIGVMAGEQLTVKNSDNVLHNINATPTTNRGFNRSQPQAGMEFQTAFAAPEVMIPVRCDVHGWMTSYIGVTSHPYNAVTGEDGEFALDRLPPGTYTIEAWHELYGTATQSVTVATGETAEVTFEFNGQVAERVPMGAVLLVDHHTGTLHRTTTLIQ
ncbi:MAG: hypothetical protein EXR95_10390 [Gemmatimonadetes bacterium]|nr:hypothetical protein [Gemmatimonadota bacterium]